jgi:hypothetical protein
MSFKEIVRTKAVMMRSAYHATYSADKKNTYGTLRITKRGFEFLKTSGIKLGPGDRVKVFYDEDSGRVALKKETGGKFLLTKNGKSDDSMKIIARDLVPLLKKKTGYDIERSSEYDIVLVPVK